MDEILDGLFISSWDIAKDERVIKSNNIQKIVNIGCKDQLQHENVEYLSFPTILDNPESVLLTIFETTNKFLDEALSCKQNVLVHCVYGQSRSAAVIVSYMIHIGFKIEPALFLMKEKHPSICINPGFLCQLSFVSQTDRSSAEYRLAMGIVTNNTNNSSSFGDSVSNEFCDERLILCKSCNAPLCSSSDRLLSSSIDNTSLFNLHLDEFWRGYRPIHTSSSARNNNIFKLPLSQSQMAVVTQDWMQDQVRFAVASGTDNGVLTCFKCHVECGEWHVKALNLMGIYNLCDLFVLHKSATKIRRLRIT